MIVTEEDASSSSLVSILSLESPITSFEEISNNCVLVDPSSTSMVGGSVGHEVDTKDSPNRKSPT